jgi:hypothetical protein
MGHLLAPSPAPRRARMRDWVQCMSENLVDSARQTPVQTAPVYLHVDACPADVLRPATFTPSGMLP